MKLLIRTLSSASFSPCMWGDTVVMGNCTATHMEGYVVLRSIEHALHHGKITDYSYDLVTMISVKAQTPLSPLLF